MARVLLLVSTEDIDVASDLVEAMTATATDALGIVAEPASCVAIAAAALGRAPRITLFPFRSENGEDDEYALGVLETLLVNGVIVLDWREGERPYFGDATSALGHALTATEWNAVVALGERRDLDLLDRWAAEGRRTVVRPREEDARPPGANEELPYPEERYAAARDAARLAALLDDLALDDRSR